MHGKKIQEVWGTRTHYERPTDQVATSPNLSAQAGRHRSPALHTRSQDPQGQGCFSSRSTSSCQAKDRRTDLRRCPKPSWYYTSSFASAQSCLFLGSLEPGAFGFWASAFSCCPRVAVARFLLPRSAAPLQVLGMKWTCRRFWVSFCRRWTGRIRGPGRGPAPNPPSTCWNCTTASTTTAAPRRRPTSSGASGTKVRRLSLFGFWWILQIFFSTACTHNLSLSHSFWKLSLKQQKHTKSTKPDTNYKFSIS